MSVPKNQINPRKLLLSKWTAIQPENREKHFQVIKLYRDENDVLIDVELLAVVTDRSTRVSWQELRLADRWQMGWR